MTGRLFVTRRAGPKKALARPGRAGERAGYEWLKMAWRNQMLPHFFTWHCIPITNLHCSDENINIIYSSFAWVKLNLLEEKIKLHLLFHFQVKKKLGQGGDWTWDPQIGTPSAIWPWPPRLCYILLKKSWVFCLKIRYFCDWLTRVPGYTRVRGPTLERTRLVLQVLQ